ncbi:GNAT family N-acetyltransferase [Aneurinibacillus tyrosinisolvens]|uniref:GNAT family N-acetyltransferase n=1 Tax=Aneurinibacillus tyrosinisolvens TaxID=1443435 RepID=UPI00063F815B|nr:GNAT family protein [Aneurinibacillus tyrosinisolvens]
MENNERVTIRSLTADDAEQYLALRLEGLKKNPEAFATTYEETIGQEDLLEEMKRRLICTDNAFSMGAFAGDRLVSIVTLLREQMIKLRHKAVLVAMYTASSERGKGRAKALLKKVIDEARKQEGLEQLNLTVVKRNEAARNLYLSLGFEVFGIEKNSMKYDGAYWDEELMVLFL